MTSLKTASLILLASLTAGPAFAGTIKSEKVQMPVARAVQVTHLSGAKPGPKENVMVNIVVQDLGGTTDMSPTQSIFLTLYRKGEMNNTDAAFHLSDIYSFEGAKLIKDGLYEISVTEATDMGLPVKHKLYVDAREAKAKMLNLKCDDFACDASENFSATVEMFRE